jgi:hypothetical protein
MKRFAATLFATGLMMSSASTIAPAQLALAGYRAPEGSGAVTIASDRQPEGNGSVTIADYKPEGNGNVTSASSRVPGETSAPVFAFHRDAAANGYAA